MTKVRADVYKFAADLTLAYESKTKIEVDQLKKWKSDKANVYLNEVDGNKNAFEQKIQTKMLSCLVKT